jgi:predicted O-methyltransferase YrrM
MRLFSWLAAFRGASHLYVKSSESALNSTLKDVLEKLEAFGHSNDDSVKDRPRRMLNITRDTGEFLSVLIRIMGARRVLEIGTSNGYSTLWLADAARAIDGKVTTVEMSRFKIEMAAKNFARSGLAGYITQIEGDAGGVLNGTADAAFDMVFLALLNLVWTDFCKKITRFNEKSKRKWISEYTPTAWVVMAGGA